MQSPAYYIYVASSNNQTLHYNLIWIYCYYLSLQVNLPSV